MVNSRTKGLRGASKELSMEKFREMEDLLGGEDT